MSDFRIHVDFVLIRSQKHTLYFRESSQHLQNAWNLVSTKNNILKATAMQIKYSIITKSEHESLVYFC